MSTEKCFENKVKTFLHQNNSWLIKYWSGSAGDGKKYTKDGIPDILACVCGEFMGIEVKAPSGKPSALQIKNLRDINASGGFAILLYPKDFEHFKNLVYGIKYKHEHVIDGEYGYFVEGWTEWLEKFKKGKLL